MLGFHGKMVANEKQGVGDRDDSFEVMTQNQVLHLFKRAKRTSCSQTNAFIWRRVKGFAALLKLSDPSVVKLC